MEDDTSSRELILSDEDIKRVWHDDEWYYALIDVVAYLLPDLKDHANYWRVLKNKMRNEEGAAEVIESFVQFKLKARDGRMRLTDTGNRTTVFRVLQSISSPRVEPFKNWLAKVGNERIEELEHPEKALERIKADLRAKGHDEKWIEERIKSDLIRNDLTDEWKTRGAKEGVEFAVLTNEIHTGTFDITIQAHKKYKLIPAKTNVRDHMTHLELALTSLSEATAITLHQDRDSQGFSALKKDAKDAGEVGGQARSMIEKTIGHSVVSPKNYLKRPKQKEVEQPSLFDEPDEPR